MKQIFSVLFFLVAIIAVQATLKETQKQKHEQEKNHKKPSLGQWSTDEHSRSKASHHAVKEVLKHAPRTVSQHEAKLQVDLGHNSGKRQLQAGAAFKDQDLKLQDLTVEDKVQHKIQSHKIHAPPSYNVQHRTGNDNPNANKVSSVHGHHLQQAGQQFAKAGKQTHGGRYNAARLDKKQQEMSKKSPKKVLNSNKSKKYKRAKRLHKFIW